MTDPNLDDDDVLVEHLRDALRAGDPIPEDAVVAALGVFGLHRVDEELAALAADSLVDAGVLVRRDQSSPRMLSFVTEGLTIEIELSVELGVLLGVLAPPTSSIIEVQTVSGSIETRSDDLGRFRVELADGPLRLHVTLGDRSVVTPWITR